MVCMVWSGSEEDVIFQKKKIIKVSKLPWKAKLKFRRKTWLEEENKTHNRKLEEGKWSKIESYSFIVENEPVEEDIETVLIWCAIQLWTMHIYFLRFLIYKKILFIFI
jgi:hypothetical protein